MSGYLALRGGAQTASVDVYVHRWGHASYGKWVGVIIGLAVHGWFPSACNFVVDDFGDLVAVP